MLNILVVENNIVECNQLVNYISKNNSIIHILKKPNLKK